MRRHRRRFGRAGGGKRSEGVRVNRVAGRLYYVTSSGAVMSTPMKRRGRR
jgi:hypothetical protein